MDFSSRGWISITFIQNIHKIRYQRKRHKLFTMQKHVIRQQLPDCASLCTFWSCTILKQEGTQKKSLLSPHTHKAFNSTWNHLGVHNYKSLKLVEVFLQSGPIMAHIQENAYLKLLKCVRKDPFRCVCVCSDGLFSFTMTLQIWRSVQWANLRCSAFYPGKKNYICVNNS